MWHLKSESDRQVTDTIMYIEEDACLPVAFMFEGRVLSVLTMIRVLRMLLKSFLLSRVAVLCLLEECANSATLSSKLKTEGKCLCSFRGGRPRISSDHFACE